MNIIIPLAGKGQRFKDDGYTMPKPLIKVFGEPLIFHVLRCLKTRETDKIHIVYSGELDHYGFTDLVKKEFPKVEFIKLGHPTRGAAETVLCGLNQITNLTESTLVIDGDTIYQDDIISKSHVYRDRNCVFYFETKDENPIYSYVNVFGNSVMEIKEKEKISDQACTGAYLFANGNLLKSYCEKAIEYDIKSKNEFYISGLYDLIIKDDQKVWAEQINSFDCLGTPTQLKTFCMVNDYTGMAQDRKKRFCFDLDGTICTFPKKPRDYSTVQPIHKNINRLKYLRRLGHTIIIQTARGMGSNKGNAGAAAATCHEEVFTFLKRFEIPYDEIYFGKPQADFYIDDLAVAAFDDLDKATGFYDAKVQPRVFNKVAVGNYSVVKTTSNPGEIYWYNNIPDNIRSYFPNINWIEDDSVCLERINGTPLSYLLTNGSFTKADIDLLFETIDKIHKSVTPADQDVYYKNYSEKLMSRYNQFKELYSKFPFADKFHDKISSVLQNYEAEKLAFAGVIHGDLVFSNIFLCDNRHLKFIDMRGRCGEVNTIFGDVMYDYAKIYQSLCGYDRIMLDGPYNLNYETELRQYFEDLFIEKFSLERMQVLKWITASHFFSLIPLHEDFNKQMGYWNLMTSLTR